MASSSASETPFYLSIIFSLIFFFGSVNYYFYLNNNKKTKAIFYYAIFVIFFLIGFFYSHYHSLYLNLLDAFIIGSSVLVFRLSHYLIYILSRSKKLNYFIYMLFFILVSLLLSFFWGLFMLGLYPGS